MQGYQRDSYKKRLSNSINKKENNHKLTVKYHDKKGRWAVFDENQEVYGLFLSPEEIVENIEYGVIVNDDALSSILSYRKKIKEHNSPEARLFYMDTIYGKNGHSLRKELTESRDLPGSEMSYDQIMEMLEDEPMQGNAPESMDKDNQASPSNSESSYDPMVDKPVNTALLHEMNEEQMYEMCESCYEEVLSATKNLYNGCDNGEAKKSFFREMYEMMWEGRRKTMEYVMKKINENLSNPQNGQGVKK